MRTYLNIWNFVRGPRDDYTTGFLLDYNYFNNYYKMIAIDLNSKQLILIQNLYNKLILLARAEGATMFFIIEEAKQVVLDFSQGTVKVLWMLLYNLANVCSTTFLCPIKWPNITLQM